MPRDAMDSGAEEARGNADEIHVDRGRASAQQFKRILVDATGAD